MPLFLTIETKALMYIECAIIVLKELLKRGYSLSFS